MKNFSKFLGIAFVLGLSINTLGAERAHAQAATAAIQLVTDAVGKVWDIIEKNKPTGDVSVQGASALPQIANSNWESLVGWRPFAIVHSSLPLKNHYGKTAVDLEYDLIVQSGGNYNGRGAYIASARIVPTKVDVDWAYTLSVKVTIASITNAGTVDNPNAEIVLDVAYDFGSLTKDQQASDTFLVRGDGFIQHVNDGTILAPANAMPVVTDIASTPVDSSGSTPASATVVATQTNTNQVTGPSTQPISTVASTVPATQAGSTVPATTIGSTSVSTTASGNTASTLTAGTLPSLIVPNDASKTGVTTGTPNIQCVAGYCFDLNAN